jgi:trimeric autotransporter adhesin
VLNAAIDVNKSFRDPTTNAIIANVPVGFTGTIRVQLDYTNSGSIPANNVTITDVLRPGFTYVAGSGRWNVSGATALTDAAGGDPVGIDYTGAGTVIANIASVAGGVSGRVTFDVNVVAGLNPTNNGLLGSPACAAPAVGSGCPELTRNTASYVFTPQGGAATAPSNTNTVQITVTQTAGVVANNSSTVSTNGGAFDTVIRPSASPGGSVTFNNFIWNTGNFTDSYAITLLNTNTCAVGAVGANACTFPTGTTFALYASDGITALPAGDITPAITAGGNYQVVVVATLPAGAPLGGGPYNVVKQARSQFNPTVVDTVTDQLTTIVGNSTDLTQGTARADSTPAGTAAVGNTATTGFGVGTATPIASNTVTPAVATTTTTTFTLFANNTGAGADNYNLSATLQASPAGPGPALPAGWQVNFFNPTAGSCATLGTQIVNTGAIAAGANRQYCAVVTVPATSTPGAVTTQGNYDIQFRIQSPTGASDTLVDRVIVNPLSALTLTSNQSLTTYRGNVVVYTHTLTNNGNTTENVTFATGFNVNSTPVAAGWNSNIYAESGGGAGLQVGTDTLVSTATTFSLAPGASRTLYVQVFVPASAPATNPPAEPPNLTTLTVTYNTGASTVSNTDTTSVTEGLTLLKEQQLVSCTGTPVAASYSSAPIPSGPGTAPGQCIAYRITATNVTTLPVTAVVINDNISALPVRINTGCGAPAVTVGTIAGTTPANGATGTVTANVGTLAASATAVLTFCVQIET